MFLSFVWTLLLLVVPESSNHYSRGRITVVVNRLHNFKGSVRVGLWNREDGFPLDPKKVVTAGRGEINDGCAVVEFDNIPAGTYAASAFHDENDNGKLDTNLFRIPKEGFGFSNDAQSRLGPPSFHSAAFKFAGKDQKVQIDITYLFERTNQR